MSDIGRELRDKAYRCIDQYGPTPTRMRELADRIDAEMVELPKDVDGKPIRVGDTVYACDDPSLEYEVSYIEYRRDVTTIGMDAPGIQTYRRPALITHERHDSWERIANELDERAGSLTKDGYKWQEDEIHDFAKRIRRLAEREED